MRGVEAGSIPTARGEQLKGELKAHKYMECSSKTQDGLKQVFDTAIQCVIGARKAPASSGRKKCLIL